MMRLEAIVTLFPDLDRAELHSWIEQRWVQPDPAGNGDWVFHEIDLARIRLIYELRRDMETPAETVPVVLSLLDQVYELRHLLKTVSRAAGTLPPDARAALTQALRQGAP